MPRPSRKNDLLKTAYGLFNQHGFHATGIDRILQESGVSKATLYKYYRSKEELIVAVLERRHQQLSEAFDEALAQHSAEHPDALPEQRLWVIFDALEEWIKSDKFYGCNFINASAEYSNPDDAIHQLASRHKFEFKTLLAKQLDHLEAGRADALAERILLLIDGAIVSAQVRGLQQGLEHARVMTAMLLADMR